MLGPAECRRARSAPCIVVEEFMWLAWSLYNTRRRFGSRAPTLIAQLGRDRTQGAINEVEKDV